MRPAPTHIVASETGRGLLGTFCRHSGTAIHLTGRHRIRIGQWAPAEDGDASRRGNIVGHSHSDLMCARPHLRIWQPFKFASSSAMTPPPGTRTRTPALSPRPLSRLKEEQQLPPDTRSQRVPPILGGEVKHKQPQLINSLYALAVEQSIQNSISDVACIASTSTVSRGNNNPTSAFPHLGHPLHGSTSNTSKHHSNVTHDSPHGGRSWILSTTSSLRFLSGVTCTTAARSAGTVTGSAGLARASFISGSNSSAPGQRTVGTCHHAASIAPPERRTGSGSTDLSVGDPDLAVQLPGTTKGQRKQYASHVQRSTDPTAAHAIPLSSTAGSSKSASGESVPSDSAGAAFFHEQQRHRREHTVSRAKHGPSIYKVGFPRHQSVRVPAHLDTIFISAVNGLDLDTMEFAAEALNDVGLQTKQLLVNLENVLSDAGSSLRNVVWTTVYVRDDICNFEVINPLYRRAFADNPPARTIVAVNGLPFDAMVQIDCIAVVDEPPTPPQEDQAKTSSKDSVTAVSGTMAAGTGRAAAVDVLDMPDSDDVKLLPDEYQRRYVTSPWDFWGPKDTD